MMVAKTIRGFEGYTVSEDGVVANARTGRVLRGNPIQSGHLQVRLGGRSGKCKLVHRLVLDSFVGPCPDGHEACHRNGNPKDNRVGNLYWGTRSDNQRDAVRHGTHRCPRGETHHKAVFSVATVLAIRADKRGCRRLAKVHGVSPSTIKRIRNGRNWKQV